LNSKYDYNFLNFISTEPFYAQSFGLKSTVEYLEAIPTKYHATASNQVHDNILSTDCFNYPTCVLNVTFSNNPSSKKNDDAVDKTKLFVSLENTIKQTDRQIKSVREKGMLTYMLRYFYTNMTDNEFNILVQAFNLKVKLYCDILH
jgi:hypothetical protein